MDEEVLGFLRSSVRSVWALELLLYLRQHADRAWSVCDLVRELRGSDFVVTESLAGLQAAGLVTAEANGTYRYAPASREFDRLSQQLEAAYRARPIAVAKAILSTRSDRLQTFADAFRLRKD